MCLMNMFPITLGPSKVSCCTCNANYYSLYTSCCKRTAKIFLSMIFIWFGILHIDEYILSSYVGKEGPVGDSGPAGPRGPPGASKLKFDVS